MHSLLCRLFAVLGILFIKKVTPTSAAIVNEEHINEGKKGMHTIIGCVYQCFGCIASCSSGYGYYDGDIIPTEWQKEMLEGGGDEAAHNVNRRAVVKNNNYLWPNGIVPYVLDRNLSKLKSAKFVCIENY